MLNLKALSMNGNVYVAGGTLRVLDNPGVKNEKIFKFDKEREQWRHRGSWFLAGEGELSVVELDKDLLKYCSKVQTYGNMILL